MPKFSIITVNFNDVEGLQKTVESVVSQSFDDFEYLVIDGGSSDGSVDYIKKNRSHFVQAISEKDNGVYEAMNKGLRLAKGDYVLFLNSGDYLVNDEVLNKVNSKIIKPLGIYYGNLLFRSSKKEFIREYPKKFTFQYFLERSLPHPGSFIKRSLFDKLFYYSEDYKIVSDWEFFVYAICKAEVSHQHLEETISVFDLQGMSNDPRNKELITQEKSQVYKKHFNLFYEDSLEFEKLKEEVNDKNVKMLIELNKAKAAKIWAGRALRFVQFIFGKKK